jgi:hypothetical protein
MSSFSHIIYFKAYKISFVPTRIEKKIYATVVLVMYNTNLVQRERERERNMMYLISKC